MKYDWNIAKPVPGLWSATAPLKGTIKTFVAESRDEINRMISAFEDQAPSSGPKYETVYDVLKDVKLWNSLDLTRANLRGANLSGANLRYANLSDANLSDANLSDANLRYANLSGANLSCADLTYANLSDANLYSANLSDADLYGANLSDAANLSYANLSGTKGIKSAEEVDVKDLPSSGPKYETVYDVLKDVKLWNSLDLTRANLRVANLSDADLCYANLRYANLYSANLYYANLSCADLSGANLSCADLSCADLYGANLSGADLSGADLPGANLSGANLSGADLSGADLSGADLSYADLHNANLSSANLSYANLSSANLTGANLSCADLYGTKGIKSAEEVDVKDLQARYKSVCEANASHEKLAKRKREEIEKLKKELAAAVCNAKKLRTAVTELNLDRKAHEADLILLQEREEEIKSLKDKVIESQNLRVKLAKQLRNQCMESNSFGELEEKAASSTTIPTAQKGRRSLMKKAAILLTVGALAGNVPISDISSAVGSYFSGADTVLTGAYEKHPSCNSCDKVFAVGTDVAICGKCGSEDIGEVIEAPLYRDRGFPMSDLVVGKRVRNGDGTSTIVLNDGAEIAPEEPVGVAIED